jgi:polyphosphate:AMP phosphotransferase
MARNLGSNGTGKNVEAHQRLNELAIELGKMQRLAREKGVPIVIVFEGWDIWGMAEKVNKFIRTLDPRGYDLHFINGNHHEKTDRPFIWRHFIEMPASGSIAVFDRSWYFRLVDNYYDTEKKDEFDSQIEDIKMLEEQHARQGWVFVKFFLNLGKKELLRRMHKEEKKDQCKCHIDVDGNFSDDYANVLPIWEHVLTYTNYPFAPWTVLEDDDESTVMQQIFQKVLEAVRPSLGTDQRQRMVPKARKDTVKRNGNLLDKVDLTSKLEKKEYQERIGRMQKRARVLQCNLRMKGRALLIVFEGWDAAGKGGSIIRLTEELNPRCYKVIPVGPPNDLDRRHHYLWRFYQSFPCIGKVAIFDRSWYGRVLVERVEGLARTEDWESSYGEIMDMERMLTRSGNIVIKFWLHMDEETQMKRFQERDTDPEKQWKMTDEDWRNRSHWGDYTKAVEDMLLRTSSEDEPWTVVPSNDKYFSRIMVLQTIIERLENELE